MERPGNFWIWTAIGALLALVLPVLGTAAAGLLFPDYRFTHLPLHSLVEGAGGLIALAMAGILLVNLGHKTETNHYPWMAVGFLGMGILDLFHAASVPGNHFVFLHSAATFSGGLFFGLVWISGRGSVRAPDRDPEGGGGLFRFPAAISVLSIAIGAAAVRDSPIIPAMTTAVGTFSIGALALNIVGGIGFLAASVFFVRRFLTVGDAEDWLFGVQTALFGTAGVLFAYSVLWDAAWWWWHVLRLAAYMAALWYCLRAFQDAERELRQVNKSLSLNNVALDRTVEERTARLRESEERFALAVRGSTDGIWDWNVPTGEVYYSPRMKELIGYTDDEFPNVFESFESRLHPDDHEWVLREIDEHLRLRKPYDVEYRLLTKSDGYRWFRARGQADWNDAGQPVRMAGSITDVTEQHRLRERFRLAVEASPAALLMVDRDGRITMANSMGLNLFGYTETELIGQPIEMLVPERFRERHCEHRTRFFQAPAQRTVDMDIELLGLRKDGSEFPVKVGLNPVETADGLAVICGVLDITDQKRTLEVMRQAKEAAESASHAKSSFLANMSHEIRTPMNGIIGMTELLAKTELRSHQHQYLSTVSESAHILLRLLNDILDFTKIEAGKLELECVEFSLSECVGRALQMEVLKAAEKGLEIACRVAPEIPDHLRGDPGRVQQVLVNLISNAVKFTESGEIFVNLNAGTVNPDSVRLHFAVSDTGIGIPGDKLENIFSAFEQAETSTTRRFGGSGLGLAICRQLVEMMHGEIGVESEPGRGSTFHFTAEFGVAPHQDRHEPAEVGSLRDLPVLVVDDNATNRRIFSEMLQFWKMRPVLAASAKSAREALHEAELAKQPIRLILLDHHMPGEDGLQFAESLKARPDRGGCPIIMLSSGTTPVDADLGQKFGIGRFMTKPVIASDLLDEVLRQFSRHTIVKPAARPELSPAAKVQPRRVLVVDDNEINRRVAQGLLHTRGHQVAVAVNGAEALKALAVEEFDVVLMDMQMPVMDGYTATAEIRKHEHETGGHVPIVAMTAEALRGDRERCLAIGMDDYVSKPVSPTEMYRAVERFPALCIPMIAGLWSQTDKSPDPPGGPFGKGDGQVDIDPPVRGAPSREVPSRDLPSGDLPSPHSPAHEAASRDVPSESKERATTQAAVIDWSVAQVRLGGGKEILNEFSDLLKQQIPSLRADIRRAGESGDFKLLRRSAHTLKGSVSYFGAEAAMQAALAIEMLARSESLDGFPGLLTALETELTQVLAVLEAGPPESIS